MRNYKIIKLKSGEDLIGTVRLTKEGSVKIHRPMVFKSMVASDMFGGMREMFMLKDWLLLSEEKIAIIQKDSINTIVKASKEVSSLYDNEKLKDDINPLKPKKSNQSILPDLPVNPMSELQQYVEEMIAKSEQMAEEESNLKEFAKPQKGDKMVFMNLVFSPDVIIELLKSGLINRNELGEMINHITNENGEGMNPNKFTGKDKDKKDLGNDWTDWPADPNSEDYK